MKWTPKGSAVNSVKLRRKLGDNRVNTQRFKRVMNENNCLQFFGVSYGIFPYSRQIERICCVDYTCLWVQLLASALCVVEREGKVGETDAPPGQWKPRKREGAGNRGWTDSFLNEPWSDVEKNVKHVHVKKKKTKKSLASMESRV